METLGLREEAEVSGKQNLRKEIIETVRREYWDRILESGPK